MHNRRDRHHWMQQAIAAAQAAGAAGEIPVGAVVVFDNRPIAVAGNRRERDRDPTAHAEIVALRSAGRALNRWQLQGCTLYVTLEPCPMCASAIAQARLDRVVYGADDPKAGAIRSVLNLPASAASFHQPEAIGGILETPCRQLLANWFLALRQSKALDAHSAGDRPPTTDR
ncbi:nucleoside deaminase [Synechococcus sp. PCC 7336]|uniref:nucleoside deaminase n=1 Tax=Synechococcus sp. PCC 7336 TaxID=195250 RepID=UPI0003451B39|nr:nucleoside deaminase [Synechococcus sp. PCC 7336]